MRQLKRSFRLAAVFALVVVASSTAKAGLMPTPDIFVTFGADYDATDDRFVVGPGDGAALRLKTDANPSPGFIIFGGTELTSLFGQFTLEVSIDENGEVFTSSDPNQKNEFEVRGTLTAMGGQTITLLKGTITEAKTEAFQTGGVIDFVATVTENGTGEPFGKLVRITAQNLGIGNSFMNDFTITSGQADIGRPVPEPTSIACFGLLACGVAVRRKRRR